ncbi:MAG: diaminopimelate epimerase [Thermoanaerobaculia bacterium]
MQDGQRDPLTFVKMSGAGNDFIMIDNRSARVGDASDLALRVCSRRLSVGGDGLILVEPSTRATFRMRYYNADGSLGEFCGNGTRCAARFALVEGIAGRQMTIETDAGIVTAEVDDDQRVTISLPAPVAFRADRPLQVGDTTVRGSSITVGVPHYVIFLTGDLWEQQIEALGRAIRYHPEMQPAGTNVNFVVVRDSGSIEVRTYERGVEAETLACGSGVVASVSVSTLFGKVQPPVKVLTRSGVTLEVTMKKKDDELRDIRLKGDARIVYRASMTPETLDGFDPDFLREPAKALAT